MKKQLLLTVVSAGLISLSIMGSADAEVVTPQTVTFNITDGAAYANGSDTIIYMNFDSLSVAGSNNGKDGTYTAPGNFRFDFFGSDTTGYLSRVEGRIPDLGFTGTPNNLFFGGSGLSSAYDGSAISSSGSTSPNANFASLFGLDNNGFAYNLSYDFSGPTSVVFSSESRIGAVPIPAAVWLFGSGLLSLVAVARRKNTI